MLCPECHNNVERVPAALDRIPRGPGLWTPLTDKLKAPEKRTLLPAGCLFGPMIAIGVLSLAVAWGDSSNPYAYQFVWVGWIIIGVAVAVRLVTLPARTAKERSYDKRWQQELGRWRNLWYCHFDDIVLYEDNHGKVHYSSAGSTRTFVAGLVDQGVE